MLAFSHSLRLALTLWLSARGYVATLTCQILGIHLYSVGDCLEQLLPDIPAPRSIPGLL